jgi:hypothetical protein
MIHFAIIIFLFVGITAVTALLFSGWAIYGVIRAIITGIGALISSSTPTAASTRLQGTVPGQPPRAAMTGQSAGHLRCPRARCHANNPATASFCRRCGSRLAGNAVGVTTPPPRRQEFAAHSTSGARVTQRNFG